MAVGRSYLIPIKYRMSDVGIDQAIAVTQLRRLAPATRGSVADDVGAPGNRIGWRG